MSNRARVFVNLAVFGVVFVVMLAWAVSNVVTVDRLEDPYDLTLYADGASGVGTNAEVAYLGVHYGRVTGVDLVDGGVRMHLRIDKERDIPIGSVPRIFRKSPIGEPYIDFNPPAGLDPDTAEYYEDGDEVVDEHGEILRASVPLEFSELLRTASDLISNIEPEQAASLLDELATGLAGRGEDLHRFTTSADVLAATFAERTDALDRLAENNTRLTAVLAEHRGALGSSISDLSALAESLREASGDTEVLLSRGTALLTLAADLIEDTRPAFDCLLGNLVPVIEVGAEPDRLASLEHYLQTGPTGYERLYRTIDREPDGTWVRVNLTVSLDNPPRQFVPPLPLPTVQPRVDCPGVLPAGSRAAGAGGGTPAAAAAAAATGDFRPSDVLARSSSALPATGAAAATSIAAVLFLAAYAARRLSRQA